MAKVTCETCGGVWDSWHAIACPTCRVASEERRAHASEQEQAPPARVDPRVKSFNTTFTWLAFASWISFLLAIGGPVFGYEKFLSIGNLLEWGVSFGLLFPALHYRRKAIRLVREQQS